MSATCISGTRVWSRRLLVIAGFMLSLLVARDAAAACANGLSAQTVNPGDNLASIITNSTATCTLTVNPGTYTASVFTISSNITVRSASGPGLTTLQVTAGQSIPVIIQALSGRCPSGATLDGFTLSGGHWGVVVQTGQSGPCASNQITGVTLRNLVIDTDADAGVAGHGIYFNNVQNSVIDSCTIVDAPYNGIFLGNASNNNIVMNNTIQRTVVQNAITVQSSSDNIIVANTITGSAFHGILLNSAAGPSLGSGSSRNRIERNTISGHRHDGVTLTDGSNSNYVGVNSIVSSSYHPVSKPTPSPAEGVGIWVNNASNGSYLFGNDVSGSPENGIDVLISTSTYMQANKVHANLHGGIWVANNLFYGDPSSPVPQDTVLHGNHVYFSPNPNIHLEGTINVDVAYNHVSGDESGTLAGPNTIGLYIHEELNRGTNVASSGVNVYENTITDVNNRAIVNGTTTGSLFFRNKFLRGSNNLSLHDGRKGLTYSFIPAGVGWDAGGFLGGNHWSDFTAASGNPDPAHHYRGFIYDQTHGNDGNSPYVDRFPYSSEHLGAPYATYSVSMVEPVAGAALAAGTKKTIRWIARGCVLVNIYYGSGTLTPTLLAFRQPNIGHFFWTLPAMVDFRNDYFVKVDCLDSSGLDVGVSASSGPFTIGTSALVLMNPGRGFRAVNNGTVRVAWRKLPSIASVNVFVKSGSGSEVPFGPFSGTWADITLPPAVSNSSQVTIRIQDSGNITRQDSVDGYFMVRGVTPSFTTALAGQNLQIGSIQVLQWAGTSGSYLVDLDLYQGGVLVRAIARNLPDFGNYTWFVPEVGSASSTIRATFKDANGAAVTQITSGTFGVSYAVSSVPTFTLQPRDQIARTGFSATFTVAADGNPAPTFQWQVSTNGGSTWTNLTNNATYSGATSTTLVISGASFSLNGNRYRAVATNTNASVASNAATLSVADFFINGGDVDGDGKGDLFWRHSQMGDVAVWVMNGATVTQGPVVVPGVPLAWQIAGIDDLNGDGKADLVWRNSQTGDVSVWLMNGTSVSQAPVVAPGVPVAWQIVGVNDLDADGKADLVWRHSQTGDVAVWLMDGASIRQGPVVATGVPLAWQISVVGDLDGDGKGDLIWRNTQTGDVSAWLMDGATVRQGPVVAAGVPLAWHITGVGDLDGDGKADIVLRNTTTGDVSAWLMNGVTIKEGPVIAAGLPLSWQIAALRDVDGDGKADVVLRNTTSGDVSIWLMNGVVIREAPIAASGVPLEWQIQK
jgi:parallel beta-helix repeat protein